MTTQELFIKITSVKKWYSGYCTKEYACIIKNRFNKNKLSINKLSEMFNYFGYELNCTWNKIKIIKK